MVIKELSAATVHCGDGSFINCTKRSPKHLIYVNRLASSLSVSKTILPISFICRYVHPQCISWPEIKRSIREAFQTTGCPKKMFILSGFEFLTLGEVFLGVTFHQKTFLFYKIFFMSKQNFEKTALFIEKIVTNKWFSSFKIKWNMSKHKRIQ